MSFPTFSIIIYELSLLTNRIGPKIQLKRKMLLYCTLLITPKLTNLKFAFFFAVFAAG